MAAARKLKVLHRDADLLVIDKPAGLVVHAGAGVRGTTLVDLLHQQFGQEFDAERAGLVHRLDKGTSGVILAARNQEAKDRLQRAFRGHQVRKRYLAIVRGTPKPSQGRIEAPVGRHTTARVKMAVGPAGRPAITEYRTVSTGDGYSLLEVDIATGRTHQIRVHLAALGVPVAGDDTYGQAEAGLDRPALHAAAIAFPHPKTGKVVKVASPLPNELHWFGTKKHLL